MPEALAKGYVPETDAQKSVITFYCLSRELTYLIDSFVPPPSALEY